MAHFGNIILTSIVTHGNSDKIRRDKSCHYWRAYLYLGYKMNSTVRFGNYFLRVPLMFQESQGKLT